ncbi:MAG: DUF4105 domain-containing protein [Bacteroidia bacterium]|nr:DUF4105 domain-containing protein [Bacteroidia bacterium]
MKIRLTLFFFLIFAFTGFAQVKLSPESKISLLTVAPGAELYSAFGHTGVWIHDPINGISQVYNYGTFDFVQGKEMEFYTNFVKGRLIYRLDTESFRRFDRVYHYYKRKYESQELNLSLGQKQKVYEFLLHNYQAENRNYLYDFIYDNCATRVVDMLDYVMRDSIRWYKEDEKAEVSIRSMLREPYLVGREWSGFGIDLILGSVVDHHPTYEQQSFLPDYLALYFDNSQVINSHGEQEPLVQQKRLLYEGNPPPGPSPFYMNPGFATFLLFLLVFLATFSQWRKDKKGVWLDRLLFFLAGLAGLILFLAWFATEHTSTEWNYNILWLFPLHIVMAFFIRTEMKNWQKSYFLLSAILIGVASLVWMFGVQSMNLAFIPLMAILLMRSILIYLRN